MDFSMHLEARLNSAQKMQSWIINKVTAGKGVTPYNGAMLVKTIFNSVLSYGTEIIPFWDEYTSKNFLDKLEII